MSGQATGWVLRYGPHPDHTDRDGKPYGARARGLRSVLTTVADAANADGKHAHPGIDGVMRGSLYGRRQAITLLDELVQEGWLAVEEEGGGRGQATVYCLPRMASVNGAVSAPKPPETVQSVPETVQSETETVQSRVHPNGLCNVKDQREPLGAGKRRKLPEPFIVTGAMQVWAVEKFPDVDWRTQTEQFRDHHRGNGTVKADWEATWRTWIRNAGTRFASRPTNGHTRPTKLQSTFAVIDSVFDQIGGADAR